MAEHLFDNYVHFSEERLRALGTPRDIAAFLATTGLPEWCAPNTRFGPAGDPATELPLQRIGAVQYLGLGEDRDDNLIALALGACDIWVLSAQGSPVYFAADVHELSLSLHEFQTCIDSAIAADSQAFVQARIPPMHLESFVSWAKSFNPDLVQRGTFWARELVRLGLPTQSLDPIRIHGRQ